MAEQFAIVTKAGVSRLVSDVVSAEVSEGKIKVTVDNSDGRYSPDREGMWHEHIWPNSVIHACGVDGVISKVSDMMGSTRTLEIHAVY